MEVAPPDANAISDLVYVPVPRDRLLEIYQVLASPPNASGVDEAAAAAATPRKDPVPDPGLVARAFRESPDRMKAFLSALAEDSPRWLSSAEISNRIGIQRRQLAGVLGAFGRRWANRYQQRGVPWFFRTQWNGDSNMWHYSLPAEHVASIRSEERDEYR